LDFDGLVEEREATARKLQRYKVCVQ